MWKFLCYLTLFTILGATYANLTAKGDKKQVTDQETLNNLTKTVGEHLKKLDGQGKLELIEIHSATHQTVAGSLYEISAKLKENDVPANCTISIWEKPWFADFLKIDVECCKDKRTYSYAAGVEGERQQEDHRYAVNSAFSIMSEESLNAFTPKLTDVFNQFSNKYPEFNYILKRISSGKTEVFAGQHYKLQITVGEKDHADQTKECKVDFYENLEVNLIQVDMECENDGKTFTYEKNGNEM